MLISVSNKQNINDITQFLLDNGFNIYSTGGTFNKIVEEFPNFSDKIKQVSDYTGFPEILNGRVKTLHPKIYGGILADNKNQTHLEEIENHNIMQFSVVIVNLYPFEQNNCIENIDIGGVTLIRASAGTPKNVSILTNPEQYSQFIENYPDLNNSLRKTWAPRCIFTYCEYDTNIFNCLNESIKEPLKYGMNPHQTPSVITNNSFKLLNGTAGYINVLDFIQWMAYDL